MTRGRSAATGEAPGPQLAILGRWSGQSRTRQERRGGEKDKERPRIIGLRPDKAIEDVTRRGRNKSEETDGSWDPREHVDEDAEELSSVQESSRVSGDELQGGVVKDLPEAAHQGQSDAKKFTISFRFSIEPYPHLHKSIGTHTIRPFIILSYLRGLHHEPEGSVGRFSSCGARHQWERRQGQVEAWDRLHDSWERTPCAIEWCGQSI